MTALLSQRSAMKTKITKSKKNLIINNDDVIKSIPIIICLMDIFFESNNEDNSLLSRN